MNKRKILWLCAPVSAYEQNVKIKGDYITYNEQEFFELLDSLADGKIVGNQHDVAGDVEGNRQLQAYSKRRALILKMRELLDPVPAATLGDILVMTITPTTGNNPTVPNELFKQADGAMIVYESGTSKFQGGDERPFFKWLRRFPAVYKTQTVR